MRTLISNPHSPSSRCHLVLTPVLVLLITIPATIDAVEYSLFGRLNQRYHFRHSDSRSIHRPELSAIVGSEIDLHPIAVTRIEISTRQRNSPATPFRSFGEIQDAPVIALEAAYLEFNLGKELSITRIGQGPVAFYGDELIFGRGLVLPGIKQLIKLSELLPMLSRVEVRGALEMLNAVRSPPSLWVGGQLLTEIRPLSFLHVIFGAGYYSISRSRLLLSESPAQLELVPLTNSTDVDFELAHGLVEIGVPMIPLRVTAQWVHNAGSGAGNARDGFSVGAAMGQLARPRSFTVQYYYVWSERDSTLALLGSELWRTGARGHDASVGYQLTDTIGLSARAFFGNRPSIESNIYELFTTVHVGF